MKIQSDHEMRRRAELKKKLTRSALSGELDNSQKNDSKQHHNNFKSDTTYNDGR